MLEKYREEIDRLDAQIIALFEARMQQVAEILEYKKAHQLPVYQEDREQKVLDKVGAQVKNTAYVAETKQLFMQIMSISRGFQRKQLLPKNAGLAHTHASSQVGFQGVQGAFGELALKTYFGEHVASVPFAQFKDVFEALQTGVVDYGVLPLENSYAGSVLDVLDLLAQYDVHIIGEVELPIEHHLLGIAGAQLGDIREVYSHPQAIQQCHTFLSKYPQWRVIPDTNTASSAKRVKEGNDPSKAAIASREAAELYGLHVLQANIYAHPNNRTHFIVLARQMVVRDDAQTITLLFTISNETNALQKCLEVISENNIPIMSIDSRPTKSQPWSYNYYVTMKAHIHDAHVQQTLKTLEQTCPYYRMLGNY